MGLESATYISGLNSANPVNATDVVGEGDDHLRLIKSTLLNTFPGITGAMTLTHTQLNDAALKSASNTFTAINYFEAQVQLKAGNYLNLYSPDNLTGVGILMNGTNFDVFASTGTPAVFRVRDGMALRIQDAGDTDYLQISHDGTDALLTSLNTNAVRFQTQSFVTIQDGAMLRVYDTADTDWIGIQHNGADVVFPHVATGSWRIQDLTGQVRIEDGAALRIYDATNADYVNINHNGIDVYADFVGTTALQLTGLTAGVRIRDGAALYLYDSTDTDYLSIVHDGTYANINAVTTDALRIALPTWVTGGNQIRCYDAGGADYMMIHNDGGNAVIDTGGSSGALLLQQASVTQIQLQTHSTAGNTSGAKVKDSGGTLRDIGFNILPVFNDDVSDTLESQHCGAINFKDLTTGITLTLEASGAGDFPVGAVTQGVNGGATGDYTITEGAGTTLYYIEPGVGATDTAGGCTVGPGGVFTIYRRSATDYYIWGSEITP